MRRRLALTVAAVTLMVAVAFVVPLAMLVRVVAEDRAISRGEQQARALAGVLAAVENPSRIETAVVQLEGQSENKLSVIRSDGSRIGAQMQIPEAELSIARAGRAFNSMSPEGRRLLVPVRLADGSITVAAVLVPTKAIREGVSESRLVLGGVALALLALAILLADRLGRSTVSAIESLGNVTDRIGRGDLEARATDEGPPEVVAVGRTVNELAGRIQDLLLTERESVADLSHRLRTPLTALELETESLPASHERDRIRDSVRRMTNALSELIREARQPRNVEHEDIDLGAVVNDRVRFWSPLAEDQGRKVTWNGNTGQIFVRGDASELSVAFDALLGNVFQHTPEGTGFDVRLSIDDGDNAQLAIEDFGPGMPEVLERGQSGAASTGLGLDIARRTAERFGGSLRISSESGRGALVEIFLPFTRDSAG